MSTRGSWALNLLGFAALELVGCRRHRPKLAPPPALFAQRGTELVVRGAVEPVRSPPLRPQLLVLDEGALLLDRTTRQLFRAERNGAVPRTPIAAFVGHQVRAIAAGGGMRAFALVLSQRGYELHHTQDGGQNWEFRSVVAPYDPRGMGNSELGALLVAGERVVVFNQRLVFDSTDGGRSFRLRPEATGKTTLLRDGRLLWIAEQRSSDGYPVSDTDLNGGMSGFSTEIRRGLVTLRWSALDGTSGERSLTNACLGAFPMQLPDGSLLLTNSNSSAALCMLRLSETFTELPALPSLEGDEFYGRSLSGGLLALADAGAAFVPETEVLGWGQGTAGALRRVPPLAAAVDVHPTRGAFAWSVLRGVYPLDAAETEENSLQQELLSVAAMRNLYVRRRVNGALDILQPDGNRYVSRRVQSPCRDRVHGEAFVSVAHDHSGMFCCAGDVDRGTWLPAHVACADLRERSPHWNTIAPPAIMGSGEGAIAMAYMNGRFECRSGPSLWSEHIPLNSNSRALRHASCAGSVGIVTVEDENIPAISWYGTRHRVAVVRAVGSRAFAFTRRDGVSWLSGYLSSQESSLYTLARNGTSLRVRWRNPNSFSPIAPAIPWDANSVVVFAGERVLYANQSVTVERRIRSGTDSERDGIFVGARSGNGLLAFQREVLVQLEGRTTPSGLRCDRDRNFDDGLSARIPDPLYERLQSVLASGSIPEDFEVLLRNGPDLELRGDGQLRVFMGGSEPRTAQLSPDQVRDALRVVVEVMAERGAPSTTTATMFVRLGTYRSQVPLPDEESCSNAWNALETRLRTHFPAP